MPWLLILALHLPGILISTLEGQELCAVTVQAVRPSGAAERGVPVRLSDAKGKVLGSVLTDEQGLARFCDLNFGNHSIAVGEGCGSITINDVQSRLPDVEHFVIRLNRCRADSHRTLTGCFFYLRLEDDKGKAVKGTAATEESDIYGRVILALPVGQTKDISVASSGFQETTLRLTCPSINYVQRRVVLRSSRQ